MVLTDVISSWPGTLYRHTYSYRYLGPTQPRKNVNSNHDAKFGDTLAAVVAKIISIQSCN